MTIFTVTLNPSLDRTLWVDALVPGELHRAELVREDLGGKGINVSRALRGLGLESRVVAVLGGWTGRRLRSALEADGYEVEVLEVDGETRQNVTLVDASSGLCTKVNEAGPSLDEGILAQLESRVLGLCGPGDLCVFSGSLAPGLPADAYARLIPSVQAAGARALLDASGAALRAGCGARPFGVKPNLEEAEGLFGVSLGAGGSRGNGAAAREDAIVGALRRLAEEGPVIAMITLGADGLVLAQSSTVVRATPPNVDAKSPIGAGDATMAGLVWSIVDGCDALETARRCAATGTAAALEEGTEVGDRAGVEALLSRIRVWEVR